MKKIFLIFLFIIVAVVSLPAQQTKTGKPKSYKELRYPKLREITIPKPDTLQLCNGLRIYLLEDHSLPLIDAQILIHTGSRYEPADKVGLAGIVGEVMRTGGTTSKTGDQFDDELEKIAASVETSIGTSSGSASMSVMKEDIDKGLSALADVLMHPAFPEDKIELSKIEIKSEISRRNDNVGSIAAREFRRLIYGPDNIYGRIVEYEHVDNITRQDLIDFHNKYFAPNNALMAIWGDFDVSAMKAKIKEYFGSWEKQQLDVPALPPIPQSHGNSAYFISKEDVNQANIYIGHLGGILSDPESEALNVADQIFGGAFASRLFKRIRSDQGLAYNVGSNWGENFDHPGIFTISASTKSQSAVKVSREIIKELEELLKNGITDAELKFGKESLLNSFVFNYDTKEKIISQILEQEFYNYPEDFLPKQKHTIEALTKEDVMSAVRKRWKPEDLTILVVGKEKDFDEPMKNLNPDYKTIDITIPQPPERIPEATPETIERGKEQLRKSLEAAGGKLLLNIHDMSISGKTTLTTPQGDISMTTETKLLFPCKWIEVMQSPYGEIRFIYDGISLWMKNPQGVIEVSGVQKEEMQKEFVRNPVSVLQNFEKPEYQIQYFKDETIDSISAAVIIVRHIPTNSITKFVIDKKTNLPLKAIAKSIGMNGPEEIETTYSDYRDIGGVKIAFKELTLSSGKKVAETIFSNVGINSGLLEESFKKP